MPIKLAEYPPGARRTRGRLSGEDRRHSWGFARDAILNWRILRKSLDARGHDDIHFIYAAAVDLPEPELARRLIAARLAPDRMFPSDSSGPTRARARCEHRPVIVGAGPAGLFAGYLLAREVIGP